MDPLFGKAQTAPEKYLTAEARRAWRKEEKTIEHRTHEIMKRVEI
jgi:hypothetical protein